MTVGLSLGRTLANLGREKSIAADGKMSDEAQHGNTLSNQVRASNIFLVSPISDGGKNVSDSNS